MIKFLIQKNAPPLLIGAIVHIKWALFIVMSYALFWGIAAYLSQILKLEITDITEIIVVIVTFWFVFWRISRLKHSRDWPYIWEPFRKLFNVKVL